MVDESRLDDLYEIYTRLENLAEDLTDKDLIHEIKRDAELYKEEYEELDEEWHKQLREEEKQAEREFNSGRI
jgi:hypothetical protein